mgnify:CR=1 FL=1|jgi:Amidases related to nicotinamidase
MEQAQKTALLVMDLQPFILQRYSETSKLIESTNKAIDAARKANIPVIFVIVGFREGFPEVSPNNKFFSGMKKNDVVGITQNLHVDPSVHKQDGDVVVIKKRFGAFAGSDLEVILKGYQAERLVLAGISTSGVVLSTVRYAADKDYFLTVLSDCCTDKDDEVHRVLMEKVFPVQADVMTSEDWIKSISKSE